MDTIFHALLHDHPIAKIIMCDSLLLEFLFVALQFGVYFLFWPEKGHEDNAQMKEEL